MKINEHTQLYSESNVHRKKKKLKDTMHIFYCFSANIGEILSGKLYETVT